MTLEEFVLDKKLPLVIEGTVKVKCVLMPESGIRAGFLNEHYSYEVQSPYSWGTMRYKAPGKRGEGRPIGYGATHLDARKQLIEYIRGCKLLIGKVDPIVIRVPKDLT